MNKIAVPNVEAYKANAFYADTLTEIKKPPTYEFEPIGFEFIGNRYDPKNCMESAPRFNNVVDWVEDTSGVVEFIISQELKLLSKQEHIEYTVIPKQTVHQRRLEIHKVVKQTIKELCQTI